MEKPYVDRSWASPDGLKLHYRDYEGPADRPPVLCLHGLTRNARDFDKLAEHLAGKWRLIVPELRGRGQSDYARNSDAYVPATYLVDLEMLLAQEAIGRFVAIGTSLGGILTMLLAHGDASRIAGAVLNDIGPVLEPEGLERIGDYVGQARSFPTWMHAARALREVHGVAYPDFEIDDWLGMAKRMMIVGQSGRIAFDYDMAIADAFGGKDNVGEIAMWDEFEALAGRPLLALRGELSDLLSNETFSEMQRRVPEIELVTVPRIGHTPTLGESESLAAIDALLARVEGSS